MRGSRKKVNSILLFFFLLCSFLLYILEALNKVGNRWEDSSNHAQIANKYKRAIENFERENETGNAENGTIQSRQEKIVYQQNITECSCLRNFMYSPTGSTNSTERGFKRLNSSCSDQGTFYQRNQNVVTFSLHVTCLQGNMKRKYEKGLVENLKMMRKYYPGYSLRLYTDFTPSSYYCTVLCTNEDVFWCNAKLTPSHGNLTKMVFRTWRFLTMGDPTVDIFLSRDLDSLISTREAAVAKDWLSNTDKAIYVMRDRPGGHNFSMMAGMWGASNNKLGMDIAGNLREKIVDMSSLPSNQHRSSDQDILERTVFELQRDNIVTYDSYNCVKWANYTLVRPFPKQRGDPTRDFVGNRVDFEATGERRKYTAFECPVECRPIYGQNWTYC